MPLEHKTQRIISVFLVLLAIVSLRVLHLTTLNRSYWEEEGQRPQRRRVVLPPDRGSIRDRFGLPLAINETQYDACVTYAHIRQIPRVTWELDENGRKQRVYARRRYIEELAKFLGKKLNLDPYDVEDMIHGKAALFPHTPFVIKADLDDETYAALRLAQKDWVGLFAGRSTRRAYPRGKTAGEVIGYMGAISSREYRAIAQQKRELAEYLARREAGEMPFLPAGFDNPLEVSMRYLELSERAYTINAQVGKSGIEGVFDETLRGFTGVKNYVVDVSGNALRELEGGREAVAGQRVSLSISAELQEYAEQLLAENESLRIRKGKEQLVEPFIRGGAIVAMDPKTGEVLTLASHPGFDPGDFVPVTGKDAERVRRARVNRDLETTRHVGRIWDGLEPLKREFYSTKKGVGEEQTVGLTWARFLEATLGEESAAKRAILRLRYVRDVWELLDVAHELSAGDEMGLTIQALYSGSLHAPLKALYSREELEHKREQLAQPSLKRFRRRLDHALADVSENRDKLLVLDLCRLLIDRGQFDRTQLAHFGDLTIENFRRLARDKAAAESRAYERAQTEFHKGDFRIWRENHFADFLKNKRKIECAERSYQRPYIEYLEAEEARQFAQLWEREKMAFLLRELLEGEECKLQMLLEKVAHHERVQCLAALRTFSDLQGELYGHYRGVRSEGGVQREQHLASAFYPVNGFGYARSQAFRQSTPLGSVFKVVTAYEGLRERSEAHFGGGSLNPLTLIDDIHPTERSAKYGQLLGRTMRGENIYRLHKGGRLPRTHPHIGKVGLVGALEQSSNIYFSILAAEKLKSPTALVDVARELGFGTPTGIELSGEISGALPSDLAYNKTALYSFAIGQHSLVVTPLQTAAMFCALGNGGTLFRPTVLRSITGERRSNEERIESCLEEVAYKGKDLFEDFTSSALIRDNNCAFDVSKRIKRRIYWNNEMRNMLFEGLYRVVNGERGSARTSSIRRVYDNPAIMRDYVSIKSGLVGKTGTAEIMDKRVLDIETPAKMEQHVWFAGLGYPNPQTNMLDPKRFEDPDIVVVVYLRYGRGGKEAAPIAAQIVKKWRELKQKYEKDSVRHSRSIKVDAISS